MTLRERFLAKAKEAPSVVITPAWFGEPIGIRRLTLAARRDLLSNAMVDGEQDSALLQVHSIIACAENPETHELLFTPGDRDMLLELQAVQLDEISGQALKHNGLLIVAAQAEAEKN